MDRFWKEIDTLVSKSGGGVVPLETLAGQGIRGVALFLDDGSVAVLGVAAPAPEGERGEAAR